MWSFLIDLSKSLHGDVSKLFKMVSYFFPLKVTTTIIFWEFWLLYQIYFSAQVKRRLSVLTIVYTSMPHELLNEKREKITKLHRIIT